MVELELGLSPGSLHPIEGLARIAGNARTPLDVKVDCLKSMAPYCVPKLATVVVKGDEDHPVIVEHVNIDRFLMDPMLVAAAQRIALAIEEPDEVHDEPISMIERVALSSDIEEVSR